MELARRELGDDAMLLSADHSGPESKHLGAFEVTFVGDLRESAPRVEKPVDAGPEASFPVRIDDAIGFRPIDLLPPDHDFAALLELASARLDEKEDPATGKRDGKPRREFACSPGLGRPGDFEAVVALVGSPGAGKTTTIMKLALTEGLLLSRPTRILSFDAARIGASERLRRFAHVLAIPFQEFENVEDLTAALKHPAPGLTFIDTAGYGRAEWRDISKLAQCLLGQPLVEVQLVLRMDRKSADNFDVIERFSLMKPARLILTALDESADIADVEQLINRAGIPVSFLGAGQRIPDDLEPARQCRLTELLSGGALRASQPVA